MKDGTTEHTEGTEGNPERGIRNFGLQVLPHDEEAERYVLAWFLQHSGNSNVVTGLFHFAAYAEIVRAVNSGGLHSPKMSPDLINVAGAALGEEWLVWDLRTFQAARDWLEHLEKQRDALVVIERMREAIYAGAVVAAVSDIHTGFGGFRNILAVSVDNTTRKINGWRPWESVAEIHGRNPDVAEGGRA